MRSRIAVLGSMLLLCALAPLAARADDYEPKELAPSWRDQAQAAYEAKDWAEAIFLYRKWLEADPRDDTGWYNLACCYALAGQKEAALGAMETAVDAGWKDPSWPTEDPDLASIRTEARFTAALERAKTRGDEDAPEGYVRHFVAIPAIGTYVAMLPPDYDEAGSDRLPLVVILHGNGSTEMRHGRLADAVGREGVVYIAPRAPYPHEGVFTGMRRPGWTWAPQDADEEALEPLEPSRRYIDSILACVQDARRRYRVAGERFFVLGHSMGAFSALTAAVLHPDRVASFYAYAGGLPEPYQDPRYLKPLAEHGVRVFLGHGKADPIVPPALTKQAAGMLKEAGVDVTVHLFDGQDHGVGPEVRERLKAWVEEVVRRAGGR